MTPAEFAAEARAFIDKMNLCLSQCFPNPPQLSNSFVGEERMRAATKLTVALTSAHERQQVGELEVSYNLGVDRMGRHLKVLKSKFTINAVRGDKKPPVVRFEYEHNKRNGPSSHIHVHSDMAGLGIILHTNGRTATSLAQQDIHYPTGGHRYRVCLEDIIQFTVDELGFVSLDGWDEVVRQGQVEFRSKQAEAVIRQNHQAAATVLRTLGYSVEGGPTGDVPGPITTW